MFQKFTTADKLLFIAAFLSLIFSEILYFAGFITLLFAAGFLLALKKMKKQES